MFPIEMQHIGKIEAVGTVQVFGYSARRVDEHVADCIYLNFAGPPTAADAVWAMLIERRALDFTDLNGRPHRLRHGGYPGLDGNESAGGEAKGFSQGKPAPAGFPLKRFSVRIEHLAIDHCILLDKRFFEPAYDHKVGCTFVFEGGNMAQKIGQHVSRCVDIAVFPEWHAGLLRLGRRERLVTPLVNHAHPVYQVTLDRARWTQVIALAVERGELTWPGEQPSESSKRLLTAAPEPEPEASTIAEAHSEAIPFTLTHEGGWTWLSFERKPDEWILTRLKSAGFRWGKRRRAWYSRTPVTHDYVEHLIA